VTADGTVHLPGLRDAVGSHDAVAGATACVVACPPHPQHGGHRGDQRLRTVSGALAERGVACLRFDYGPWDRGRGERSDARNAVAWARERYDRVGLFGFSFGGGVALLVGADETGPDVDRPLGAVAALAPVARLADGSDAADAVDGIDAPLLVVYGSRDTTAGWEPVVEAARERAARQGGTEDDAGRDGSDAGRLPPVEAVEWSADHFFAGQTTAVAAEIAAFLAGRLGSGHG
jgi:hypothetical protein